MAKISINVIQTSSEGNCISLYDGKSYLFLDFGCDPRYIKKYFREYKIKPKNISGILITHAHLDHYKSLKHEISYKLDTYISNDAYLDLKNKNKKLYCNFIKFPINKKWVKIKNSNWKFLAIKTIHNALGSVCFIIKNKNKKILYLTDTEYIESKYFKGMDCYLVESNYGFYLSNLESKKNNNLFNLPNHLNSADVEKIIKKYPNRKTKYFIMIHVSHIRNKNFEILDFMKECYSKNKMSVDYVKPYSINDYKITI